MKIWFDRNDVNFNVFTQEQFLIVGEFDLDIVLKDKDFNNIKWIEQISEKVKIVDDVESADIILYPKKLDSGIKKYINLNKKVLAFYNDDNDVSFILDEVILFRTSIVNSRKRKNENVMPAWSSDFNILEYRKKHEIPTIGFCGSITHPIRKEVIEQIEKNSNSIPNFIIRESFWGGKPHDKNLRNEYINNMINSDFVICCRGAGNFSYRLYETMNMGRIPIIIDTDISLPCHGDGIDYNKFIMTENVKDVPKLIEKMWKGLTEETYLALQMYSRRMYDEYISPPSFASHVKRKIMNK